MAPNKVETVVGTKLKAFFVAVQEFRKHKRSNASTEEIDKILQILSKTSDISLIEGDSDFFCELGWLIEQLLPEQKSPTLWTLVSLLGEWSVKSEKVRSVIQQGRILAVLVDLYQSLPSTTKERAGKLLETIRNATYGYGTNATTEKRIASCVSSLIPKLISNISNPAENLAVKTNSIFVLISLTRQNYPVAKFLLSQISDEERKDLLAKSQENNKRSNDNDSKFELFKDHLNNCLNRWTLSKSSNKVPVNVLSDRLEEIREVVFSSYREEDSLSIRRLVEYIYDLCWPDGPKNEIKLDTSAHVQQVILEAELGENSSLLCNEAMLQILKCLIKLGEDMFSIAGHIFRGVLLFLEANVDLVNGSVAALSANLCAFSLVRSVLSGLFKDEKSKKSLKTEDDGNNKENEQRNNIKNHQQSFESRLHDLRLQFEPLVGLFGLKMDSVAAKASKDCSIADLKTAKAAVLCLVDSLKVDSTWAELAAAKLKPGKVIGHIKENVNSLNELRVSGDRENYVAEFLGSLILLVNALRSTSSGEQADQWRKAYEKLKRDREIISKSILEKFENGRKQNEDFSLKAKLLWILKSEDQSTNDEILFKTPIFEGFGFVDDDEINQLSDGFFADLRLQDQDRIQTVLDQAAKAVEKDEVDESLAEILELSDFRLCNKNRENDALKSALKASDDQLSNVKTRCEVLESDNRRMAKFLQLKMRDCQNAKSELCTIRNQFSGLQEEATNFREKITSQNERQNSEIEKLEDEKSQLISKVQKYKSHNENLQEAIKEHQGVQEELQLKLKAESKRSAELTAVLEKREEKLKKKDRQLEDVMTRLEVVNEETEGLRKEAANLQSLTKRQEQVLAKKDKQLADMQEEIDKMKTLHEQVSKLFSSK